MTIILPAGVIAAALISLCAVVVATVVLTLIAWERLVISIGRRKLLSARNEIFFLFVESGLGPDHPAHREARRLLNRLIRYAHKLTWWRLIVARLTLQKPNRPDDMRELTRLRGAFPDLADDVERRTHEAYLAVFEMMQRRSLFLFVTGLVGRLSARLGRGLTLDRPSSEKVVDGIALAAEQEERALPAGRRLKAA